MAAVEEQNLTEWRAQCGPYLGDISALSFLHLPSPNHSLPFLLAGLGSEIMVYDLDVGKVMRSFTVFQGIRVHGIATSFVEPFLIVVFGETRVKLFRFSFDDSVPQLTLVRLLPKFSHWVLDVCFLEGCSSDSNVDNHFLVVGCSDNSVHIWDISNFIMVLTVQSPVRCLLYSMRLWGPNLEVLRIASGTIFNEIIVWKVAPHHDKSSSRNAEDHGHQSVNQLYEAVHICKLIGHEGSIFRIAWLSCGSKLLSVSDDRSARVWAVPVEREDSLHHGPDALVLFGHNARVWDCSISDFLIVTASEDCTCRIWGVDGEQLQVIKEHIGRGIWRCLYDPKFSILITAGFDSAIKVHQPHVSLSRGLPAAQGSPGSTEMFSICIPTDLDHIGLTDSKSEYVRCLRFSCHDTLYVATNHGYVYHAKLCSSEGAQWNQLVQVSSRAPIICMDLLSVDSFELDCGAEDFIAIGDGKGNMTVIGVIYSDCNPTVRLIFTWAAEMERQLLGTYWCKSLGRRYIFTADPRGTLKLWRLPDPSSHDNLQSSMKSNSVSRIAEFVSSYGMRIMCLDACLEEEVIACGDLRGNLVLFPLLKNQVLGTCVTQEVKIPPVNHFKGVHGISSVSSVSIIKLGYNQMEICSTGADGCICYLEYDKDMQNLQFTGMKQVKELTLIEHVSVNHSSADSLSSSYAAGFASVDFIIWNLATENKVVKISCGGWRRPHSYYLGDVPEMKSCFAYVKDEMIHIHRNWTTNGDRDRKIYPQSLHMQFHGREIHSLCFIYQDMLLGDDYKHSLFSKSSWIATGCEDGTVRLTWYSPGNGNWSTSKLLGEHVGGSAVRSICCVSKLYTISSDTNDVYDGRCELNATVEDKDNPTLLISVGAKRVLTSWLLKSRRPNNKNNFLTDHQYNAKGVDELSMSDSMTFQWLSTDMPAKYSVTQKNPQKDENDGAESVSNNAKSRLPFSERGMMNLVKDKYEDDWRYLAVTAFLVKCAGSRISICFVVVACSDATLMLRALILPFRLWFDVALLVPLVAPVLSLQHIIFPIRRPYKENIQVGNVYVAISGSTDGSVAFWDLTDSIEAFMHQVSVCNVEKFFDCQKRPRTGRGSQGGRWWRSLKSDLSKKRQDSGPVSSKAKDKTKSISYATCGTSSTPNDSEGSKMVSSQAMDTASTELESKTDNSSVEVCEIQPLHLQNIHQSGVNCLHVSEINGDQSTSHVYSIISGGDDQALNHLIVEFSPKSTNLDSEIMAPDTTNLVSEPEYEKDINFQRLSKNYVIRFLNNEKIPSAHSSSVKGVWTDGSWVFSTGLDQRVRCWHLHESKLIEHAHLIVSVPEPESLSARACGRNHYQIAVAGRGMQIVDFSGS